MKKEFKGFVSGVLVMGLAVGLMGTAVATAKKESVIAEYSDIKIFLENAPVTPTDANGNVVEPFSIDGTTYLPVRAIGDALGLDVEWEADRRAVLLSSKSGSYQAEKCYNNFSVPDFQNIIGADAYVKATYDTTGLSNYYDPNKFTGDTKDNYVTKYAQLLNKYGFYYTSHDKDDSWNYTSMNQINVRIYTEKSSEYVVIEITMPQGTVSQSQENVKNTPTNSSGSSSNSGDSGGVSADAKYLADRTALDSAYQAERAGLTATMDAAQTVYETAGYGLPEGDQRDMVIRNAEQNYNSAVNAVSACDAKYQSDLSALNSKYGM